MNIWPWSTIRKLRDEVARLKTDVYDWETAYDTGLVRREALVEDAMELRSTIEGLRRNLITEGRVSAALRDQLAEATKNDTRDPTTGRFVKAER